MGLFLAIEPDSVCARTGSAFRRDSGPHPGDWVECLEPGLWWSSSDARIWVRIAAGRTVLPTIRGILLSRAS